MAMGFHDSLRHIDEGMRAGRIDVKASGLKVYISGDTYPVKEHLKKEFDARWDKDGKCWVINAAQWGDNYGYMVNQIEKINNEFGTKLEVPAAE